MKQYDVIIVGGGPIGGYIASNIAKKNYRVAIFEKNKKIGMPLNCAGLVTNRVFDFLDIPKKDIIQNKIKGANIHSPSGKILTIGGDKIHALAINRTLFDQEIIKTAEKQGADVFLGHTVLSMQKNQKGVEITTSKKLDAGCKILIGADGPFSKVRDRFVFPEPKEFLRGIGAIVEGCNLNADYVEIFIGNKIAPGFFAWMIPTNKSGTKARIGLSISKEAPHPPKFYFSHFLKNKQVNSLLDNGKIISHIGGVIPLGALRKTYASNVMLVGDAAAQVKPTSGGGIYPGLLCANRCSSVAIESLKNNNFKANFLKNYHKSWMKEIGKELNLGLKFRSIYKNLSDSQFDKYAVKFQNPKIVEIINRCGDMDYPSKLIKPLIKRLPLLLRLVPKAI